MQLFLAGGGLSGRRHESAIWHEHYYKTLNMKWILLSVCGCSLLFATGCSSMEWRGHANNARLGGVAEGPPAMVVCAPADATGLPEIVAR
jgi:hypothetical protein